MSNRQIGGSQANAFGKLFENLFFARCKKLGIASTRFPPGCKVLGKNKFILVKTPFDFILSYKGKTALIDAKTTDSDSFSYSKIVSHQVEDMMIHQISGAIAGYIIWFRKSDSICFIKSLKLVELSNHKESINHSSLYCEFLGYYPEFDPRIIFM